MRNQRGYGTQKNWMALRQELLYYIKGAPAFNVEAEYTDIPKILRGYYKEVNGVVTENTERSKSDNIRAGNVWVDIQQVFYRMEENVNGCYAQKPLKSCERIIRASSNPGDLVFDFFAHSGSTLLAAEMLRRRCYTMDIDPVFCEIAIRRLERFRATGKTGWQNSNPFSVEIASDRRLEALTGPAEEQGSKRHPPGGAGFQDAAAAALQLTPSEKLVQLIVAEGFVEVSVEVKLEVLFRDVELAFTHVAFMLLVRVADITTRGPRSDVGPRNPKGPYTVCKKQPVEQDFELPWLHLLDVAVKPVLLPSGEWYRLSL